MAAMDNSILEVIVVGGGHAGLCVSYYLTQHGITHNVFERGRIGETWHTQRWNSFKLNSANKLNLLPAQAAYFNDPDSFAFANEYVLSLENYAKQFNLSVNEYCNVFEVTKDEQQNVFQVAVSRKGKVEKYFSKQLVVASGAQNCVLIPAFANKISSDIVQLHTIGYKSPAQLPAGNVLVVGSAQSGTQIAEDLLTTNKKIFFSTGNVGRIPRRYRGKDILDWLIEAGFYDVSTSEVTDPLVLKMKPPQVSGVGERGKTCSLQALAKRGVVVLGSAYDANAQTVFLQLNGSAHIKFGDEFSAKVKTIVDNYIKKNNVPASLPEVDVDDIPDENASCASDIPNLNFKESDITSIIWTTGFSGDFSYLKLPILSEENMPKHQNGISEVEGLYFIGLPWLRKRKSAIILGISDDAAFIVNHILQNRLHNNSTNAQQLPL